MLKLRNRYSENRFAPCDLLTTTPQRFFSSVSFTETSDNSRKHPCCPNAARNRTRRHLLLDCATHEGLQIHSRHLRDLVKCNALTFTLRKIFHVMVRVSRVNCHIVLLRSPHVFRHPQQQVPILEVNKKNTPPPSVRSPSPL